MIMKPFSLLVKPASADCNLRCSYCFYLDRCNLYPQESRHRMSEEVLESLISSYMATDQPIYSFGWQGGEPTLMGVDFFRKVVALQEKYGRSGVQVANGLQTNATLIDDEFAAHLSKYRFLVGVSLDGPEEVHNIYRLGISGRGSHKEVIRGIGCLQRNHTEFNVLTLVSTANVKRAREIYHYFRDMGLFYHQYIPCVEFDEKAQPLPFTISGSQWGDFLCEIFDEWRKEDTHRVSIRLFDSILTMLVDGYYSICHMGGNCCQYFVVEYNGDVYPCDFFVESQKKLGNIREHSWMQLNEASLYHEFGMQKNDWNLACNQCEFLQYCSGDCLKHRVYKNGSARTASWLCEGWKQFFQHSIPYFKELAKSILKERERMNPALRKRGYLLYSDIEPGRNDICYCGSGKKYKKCHGVGK